jgi:hypothetical protein
MGLHNITHFLQDGTNCHEVKIVVAWFNARPGITLINWPENSPDLNPMELDEAPVKEHQLQKHGRVEGGDQETVDPEDGGQ